MTVPRRRHWLQSSSELLYRAFLWLYPRTFRRLYGEMMVQVFRDRWRVERDKRFGSVALQVWWYAIEDLMRTVPAELRNEWVLRRANRHGSRRLTAVGHLAAIIESLLQDLRLAVRTLVANPAFTAVAVVTLAVGIGANSAIYTVVKDLMIRPLPFEGAERVVYLGQRHKELGFTGSPSPASVTRWRERAQSFEVMETYDSFEQDLVGGVEPVEVSVIAVSLTFMSSFGIKPVIGRAFLPDDAVGEPVAMLSRKLWQEKFGADPEVVGRRITLGDSTYTIVGVQPSGFRLVFEAGTGSGVWVPHAVAPGEEAQSGTRFQVIARRKAGVTVEQAQAELDVIGVPGDDRAREWAPFIIPSRGFLGTRFVTGLWVLFGVVGFVLLIACSNVANMSLAKGMRRARELAIRLALGATRGRVLRLLLVESLVLCVVSSAAGLLMARWTVDLIAAIGLSEVPQLSNIAVDSGVVAFTVGMTFMTTLLFGWLPAVHLSRAGGPRALGDQVLVGRTAPPSGGSRELLVAAEVALALVLLIGAGLMVKSFRNLANVDPGVDLDNLGAVDIELPERRYGDARQQGIFFERLLEDIRGLPGVDRAVVAGAVPPRFSFRFSPPEIEGREREERSRRVMSSEVAVAPGYFHTVGTPILRGRGFTEADRTAAASVVVVNEALARRYWPRGEPIGRRVRFRESDPWLTIIGVAGNVKVMGLDDDEDRLQVYYPSANLESPSATFIVRGGQALELVLPLVKERVWARDPDLPIKAARVEEMFADTIGAERFVTGLFTLFAALAIGLAAIGVYGVISLMVNQRVHELGVRMALGARPSRIMWTTAGQAFRPVALGIAVGLLAAVGLTRVIANQLFAVQPTDPVIFGIVVVAVGSMAVIASYIPARRVLRIDPMIALRDR